MPIISVANTTHVCTFTLIKDDGPCTGLALGGYRSREGKVTILHLIVGRSYQTPPPTPILLDIEGASAFWQGLLRGTAQRRLDATPKGGVFRYRNKPLTRLTDEEIRALMEGQTFQYGMFPFLPGTRSHHD